MSNEYDWKMSKCIFSDQILCVLVTALHSDRALGVFQVWFKNRRARRKRQGGGSKVKSPQRSQTQIFNTVL